MNTQVISSPLGSIILLSDSYKLLGLWFSQDEPSEFLENLGYQDVEMKSDNIIKKTEKQLQEYFIGKRKDFTIPLSYSTTAFRDLAWKALQEIPYGETRSYLDQAKSIGNHKASRAVGQANHHNPISIIIPCHRVLSSCGTLTGYASGLEKKKWLLEHEKKFV